MAKTRTTPRITIPDSGDAKFVVDKREVRLTNLNKPFWPERGITKGMLIQYYADVAPVLLPLSPCGSSRWASRGSSAARPRQQRP